MGWDVEFGKWEKIVKENWKLQQPNSTPNPHPNQKSTHQPSSPLPPLPFSFLPPPPPSSHLSHRSPQTTMSSESPIEHQKPKEERTYEQSSMLDTYLHFHFGDQSPITFITTTTDNTHDTSISTNTLQCSTTSHQLLDCNFGDFGFLDQTTNQIGKPYGADFLSTLPNFPSQVAKTAIHFYQKCHPNLSETTSNLTALEVGCSVGRTCLDLAAYFPTVTGLDFSHLFVQTADAIARGQPHQYRIPIEGELSYQVSYQCSPAPQSAINFIQGDACNLPTDKQYSCITGANLIDRLPDPTAFLTTLPHIVQAGGIVVLASPYTWLEQYTPRHKWLPNLCLDKDTGSVIDGDKPTQRTTFEALFTIMNPKFELIHQSHLPFFIHETARKAQYSLSHCTVWRRRD